MIAGGNAVGQICKSGVDESGLGRWVYACLNGQYNKKIWVIGVYRLGNNWSTGDETAYQQQQCLLIQQGHQDPDPGAMWDKDIINFINKIP
eukprot:1465457-Ditylum_brightwellii.AAC.1